MVIMLDKFKSMIRIPSPYTIKVVVMGRRQGIRYILLYLYGQPKGVIEGYTMNYYIGSFGIDKKEDCPVLLREKMNSCLLPIYHYMLESGGMIFDVRVTFKMRDELGVDYAITIITSVNVLSYDDLYKCLDELARKYIEKYGDYEVVNISELVIKCRVIKYR
jgi:hypothetical protein